MNNLKYYPKTMHGNMWQVLMHLQLLVIFVLLYVLLGFKWEWVQEHINSMLVVTLVATVLGALIVKFLIEAVTYMRFYTRPYLTFEADFTQVFHLSKKVETLEYSVGEKGWKELGTQNIVFGGNRGKLLLRGKSRIGTNKATILFAKNIEVICTGDIRTLVDYEHYERADTSQSKFDRLFQNCTQLVVAPELPIKNLAVGCYYLMFAGCTSLKTAPELPAENLADDCYSGMFMGCTSLEYAPEMPAENLAKKCYSGMFLNCTSIEFAPELPAKKLADECYSCMFYGCASLKYTPELSADCLSVFCYSQMFSNCTSLITAPELPAENLIEGCYYSMFLGCNSLSIITMMAIDINAKDCLENWLEGTSSKGTFYKNKYADWRNDLVVPQGWEVKLI